MTEVNLFTADHFCIYRLDSNWYALPATAVREVLPRPEITPVPTSSPVLAGLSHVRNEFIAVVDLSIEQILRPQMLVVLGVAGAWGLLVDEVSSLASLEVSRGNCADTKISFRQIITGSATYQGIPIMVVDPEKARRFAEAAITEKWESMNA